MTEKKATLRQLERYPNYLAYLKKLDQRGIDKVSSPMLAGVFNCSEEQVRKDLHLIAKRSGKPGSGRSVKELIEDIEDFLGYNSEKRAIVMGVGNLGTAFLRYNGFIKAGIDVVAGFDSDPKKLGKSVEGKPIYASSELKKVIEAKDVTIAIVTVPAGSAQSVADELSEAGIKAICNFSPAHLNVDDSIEVLNVDLAATLAVLSHKVKDRE